MATAHWSENVEAPAPLEFFQKDSINHDNQALIERDAMRWRLLGRFERMKLKRYVRSLRRELRAYNALLMEVEKTWQTYQRALKTYRATSFINDQVREQARAKISQLQQHGREKQQALRELQLTYERYTHYAGWIDYERKHRKDLKAEDKLERKIRRDMRREAKWLETLLIDVFRKTAGCHHISSNGNGKEITRTPKFERSAITADAHFFWVSASKRTLFGWRWKLPYNVTIERLTDEEVLANMRAATKRQVDAVWSESGQLMYRVSRLDSPDALPKNVQWRDAMKFFPDTRKDKLPYTIGVTQGRKFQWFDFASDPHVLVAGKSQSGKSNLVNGIIGTLASTHTPDELRIVLIDQKGGIEFTHWQDLPHVLWDMVKTLDEVKPVLDRLVNIMRKRMSLLEKTKAKDIAAYNARVDTEYRLARVLVLIDEMNTFVGLGQDTEDIHNLIMLLVSQGRAVGVHVIAATQHPEVKVIPGRIKTNMSVRLSGAMPTVSASQIVLDSPEAARIPNIPGRFIAVVGLKTLVVQCPRMFDEDIAGVVSAARHQYTDVPNELRDYAEQPRIVAWDETRVLKAVMEWTDGALSGQKLHKLLGSESPGERALSKVCRRIVEQAAAVGSIEYEGEKFRVKKLKRGYYLKPFDQTDNEPTIRGDAAPSESAAD